MYDTAKASLSKHDKKHQEWVNSNDYLEQWQLHNKRSQRPPHSHYNRDKNICHIHTSIVSRHLATRGMNKNTAYTLVALKRYFPASLVAPLPNSSQIKHPFSNHTHTKSMPNHIHHHYTTFVTLTHTTHIICSTSPRFQLLPLACSGTARRRSFIWQIGVNSSIQDHRQADQLFLWSRVSRTRQR